jgi:hypothetical protein
MACAAWNAIGADIISLDVSVDKKFHVTEGKYFESRREFFNHRFAADSTYNFRRGPNMDEGQNPGNLLVAHRGSPAFLCSNSAQSAARKHGDAICSVSRITNVAQRTAL